MAAVVHLEPRFDQPVHRPRRASLRLVEPPRQPRPRRTRRTSPTVLRRRRVLAALVGLGLVLTVARAGAALGGTILAAPERRPPHVQHVVVEPGDTLWSIAQRAAPGRDPRALVDELARARGTTTLVPGETVAVPAA